MLYKQTENELYKNIHLSFNNIFPTYHTHELQRRGSPGSTGRIVESRAVDGDRGRRLASGTVRVVVHVFDESTARDLSRGGRIEERGPARRQRERRRMRWVEDARTRRSSAGIGESSPAGGRSKQQLSKHICCSLSLSLKKTPRATLTPLQKKEEGWGDDMDRTRFASRDREPLLERR